MMRLLQLRVLAVVLCLGLSPNAAAAQTGTAQPLRVLTHGPEGEVASLEEAKEIRVVFSEPMVTLGRIPDRVTAPFFRVSPALPGTFRWSGTTILIFTPDPQAPAAVRDQIRRHHRHVRDRGERPEARAAAPIQLRDADGEAARDQLVSPRRPRRRADGHPAAVQPAGGRERRRAAHLHPVRSPRRGRRRRCRATPRRA